MVALFALADSTVTREQISAWLKKEGDVDAVNCSDTYLAIFLNGLINEMRGKKEGPQSAPEKRINNNIILTKLKIAFNLKAEDIIAVISSTGMTISKHELSAFFRKSDHKHFRQCKDQFLRNFIQGLEKKYYVKRPEKYVKAKEVIDEPQDVELKNTNYKQAKPNASKIYVNPNKKASAKPKSERKVLKLKPSDIWKE